MLSVVLLRAVLELKQKMVHKYIWGLPVKVSERRLTRVFSRFCGVFSCLMAEASLPLRRLWKPDIEGRNGGAYKGEELVRTQKETTAVVRLQGSAEEAAFRDHRSEAFTTGDAKRFAKQVKKVVKAAQLKLYATEYALTLGAFSSICAHLFTHSNTSIKLPPNTQFSNSKQVNEKLCTLVL